MSVSIKLWHSGYNRFITIELCPDDPLFEYHYGGPTDEGYHYVAESYELIEGTIHCSISARSKDCDGRLDENSDYLWPSDGELGPNGCPKWTVSNKLVHDHSAIAANY